ncbi:MAG: arsenate reductase ArsC [Thermodesulforhabdaceae bacterium]|jgi:arsenate reductase
MKKKILFLCTGNSCRSQMAEGWTRFFHSDWLEAYSAGVNPHGIDPRAVKVMQEAGVDISSQRSKSIDEVEAIEFDYVITLCDSAKKSCPVFPAKTLYAHVPFDDPPILAMSAKSEEEALSHYRRVRDEIKEFVKNIRDFLESRKQEG